MKDKVPGAPAQLRSGWFTPGGHPDFWGVDATYSLLPESVLPPIDTGRFDGTFAWLPPTPRGDDPLDFADRTESLASLEHITEAAAERGLALPPAFTTFLSSPDLHRRVPTCTACFLDVSRLVETPAVPDGALVRFMNDQQNVLLWYLHLRQDGGHAVLGAFPEWRDEATGETLEDAIDIPEYVVCAPTFEAFMFRFWIENTIWYSLQFKRALTPEQFSYVDHARKARAAWAAR